MNPCLQSHQKQNVIKGSTLTTGKNWGRSVMLLWNNNLWHRHWQLFEEQGLKCKGHTIGQYCIGHNAWVDGSMITVNISTFLRQMN